MTKEDELREIRIVELAYELQEDDGDDALGDGSLKAEYYEMARKEIMGKCRMSFMDNPFWRGYYENAPEGAKAFIRQQFQSSSRPGNDSQILVVGRQEVQLKTEDWKYLYEFARDNCFIGQAVGYCRQAVREISPHFMKCGETDELLKVAGASGKADSGTQLARALNVRCNGRCIEISMCCIVK